MRRSPARAIPGSARRLLALLAACATQPPAAATRACTQPAPAAPAPPPIPPPTHPGLTLAAVGDMMLGTDFPENILPDDDGLAFLEAVTPMLTAPDVTFGNLEGVLQDGGEPVKQCKDKRICFLFRTPTRYATYFKLAGFDVMSLANNHARDFGEDGRSSSMAALDSVGIHHSGREGTIASFIANGRRVAMIAFAPNVGSNSLNDPQIGLPLVAELASTHDIVIVSFHGGAEGNGAEVLPFAREIFAGEDRGNVVEFAHAMIDAGADIVLGHGPHVVRPHGAVPRPAHRLQPGQFRDLLRHQRRRHPRHRADPAGDARRRRKIRRGPHRADDPDPARRPRARSGEGRDQAAAVADDHRVPERQPSNWRRRNVSSVAQRLRRGHGR